MTEAEIRALREHVKEMQRQASAMRQDAKSLHERATLLDCESISLDLLIDRLEKGDA